MINIDDLIGVRYKLNGRNIREGLDCYGLAIEVENRFGHKLPDYADMDQKYFLMYEEKCLRSINVKEISEPISEGDLILIKNAKGIFGHIGVYLGKDKFIHCNTLGVHIDRVSQYKNFIGKVYQWQE